MNPLQNPNAQMNLLHHFILMNQLKRDILNAAADGTDETPPEDWDYFAEWLRNVQSLQGNSPRPNLPRIPIRPPVGNISQHMNNLWQWAEDWQRQLDAIQDALRERGINIPDGEPWNRLPDRIITIPPVQLWNQRPQDSVTIPQPFITDFSESLTITPFNMVRDDWEEFARIPQNIITSKDDRLEIDYIITSGLIAGQLIIRYGYNDPQVYNIDPIEFKPGLSAIYEFEHEYLEIPMIIIEDEVLITAKLTVDEDAVVQYIVAHDIDAQDEVQIGDGLRVDEHAIVYYPETLWIELDDVVELSEIAPFISAEDTWDPDDDEETMNHVHVVASGVTQSTASIEAKPGGTAIAVVTARSPAGSTIGFSSGWELVSTTNPHNNFSNFPDSAWGDQSLWVFTRKIDKGASGNIFMTVTQNVAQLIHIQLFMFNNEIILSELGVSTTGTQRLPNLQFPLIPDKMPYDRIFWALSAIFWSGEGNEWVTTPNNIDRFSYSPIGPILQPRQTVFIDNGEREMQRTFTPAASTSQMGSIMLRMNEPQSLLYWHTWKETTGDTMLLSDVKSLVGKDVIAVVTVRRPVIIPEGWSIVTKQHPITRTASPGIEQSLYVLHTTAISDITELLIQQTHMHDTPGYPERIYIQLISLTENVDLYEIWQVINTASVTNIQTAPKQHQDQIVMYIQSSIGWWSDLGTFITRTIPDDIAHLRATNPGSVRQEVFFDFDGTGAMSRTMGFTNNNSNERAILMVGVDVVEPFPRRYPSVPLTSNNAPIPYGVSASSLLPSAFLAFDYNTDTAWNSGMDSFPDQVNTEGHWIQVDLGNPRLVTRYIIRGQSPTSSNGFPKDFQLFGSHDGVEWEVIDTQVGFATNYEWYFEMYLTGNITAFQFYRLHVTQIQSGTQLIISEFELWRDRTAHRMLPIHPTMTDSNLPTNYIVSASSQWNVDQTAWRAFDETPNRWWTTATNSPQSGWIQLDMGEPKSIMAYSIASRSQHEPVGPSNFTLSGSNNGTNWDVIDERTNILNWFANSQRQVFELSQPRTYQMYRLNVTGISQSHLHLTIGEIEFLNLIRLPLPLVVINALQYEAPALVDATQMSREINTVIGTDVFAVVLTRNDFTVSQGWEEVAFMQDIETTTVTVYRQTATTERTSITVNGVSPNRMGLYMINFSRKVDIESVHEVLVVAGENTAVLTPSQKQLRQQALYVCANHGTGTNIWSTTPSNTESMVDRIGSSVGQTLGSMLSVWFDNGSNRVINRSFIRSAGLSRGAGVLAIYFADEPGTNIELIPQSITIDNADLTQVIEVGGSASGEIVLE